MSVATLTPDAILRRATTTMWRIDGGREQDRFVLVTDIDGWNDINPDGTVEGEILVSYEKECSCNRPCCAGVYTVRTEFLWDSLVWATDDAGHVLYDVG